MSAVAAIAYSATRSGTIYYKPDLSRSCCPHYTIRYAWSAPRRHLTYSQHQQPQGRRFQTKSRSTQSSQSIEQLCDRHRIPSESRYTLPSESRVSHPTQRGYRTESSCREKRRKRDKFLLKEAIHCAEYSKLPRPKGQKSDQPIEPAHKFEVNLESDASTKEKSGYLQIPRKETPVLTFIRHEMFLRYQTVIHKDPPSRWKEPSFKRFLCTGLDRKIVKTKGKTQKLGSYHQCYRLDGKLVAVAVLDLLPHAVSSVYLLSVRLLMHQHSG